MFVLALTSFGVSRRLLTYQRMADAMMRVAVTSPSEAQTAQIYRVAGAEGGHGGASAAGLARGVFVGAVDAVELNAATQARGAQAARAQLLAAIALERPDGAEEKAAAAQTVAADEARRAPDEDRRRSDQSLARST